VTMLVNSRVAARAATSVCRNGAALDLGSLPDKALEETSDAERQLVAEVRSTCGLPLKRCAPARTVSTSCLDKRARSPAPSVNAACGVHERELPSRREVSRVAVQSLVGRNQELASTVAFLERVRAGPYALLLEGEAGIGKSRVWREAVEHAFDQGFRILVAHPGGGDVKLAFAGLTDLLGGSVSELLPALPQPQRRALEIALLLEEPDGTPPDDRAVAAAFRGCLSTLARHSPVLLAVDDIQWLDPASARVLEFACRRLDADPVGLFATVRLAADEADPAELIASFGPDRAERLTLGPLTVAAIYELVRNHLGLTLSRPTLVRVHDVSGGNPFFALELARALGRASADVASDEPLPVPANLHALVRDRLTLLTNSAAKTLLFAAGLSRPTVSMVELAVGARAQRDLKGAARADVLELLNDDIRFKHPLLPKIHFDSASPRTRRAVHRRLAEVVADPEEQARHLALAADGPAETVAATLARVSERARSRGALTAAAELAEKALLLTPPELADQRHARVLAAAEQCYAAGSTSRAVELLAEAAAEASPGPHRAELLWSLGKITFEGQDTRVGREFARRALEEAAGDEMLRARILAGFVDPTTPSSLQASQSLAAESAELAERLGDKPTLARALSRRAALGWTFSGSFDAEAFERAAVLEEELGGFELDYGPTAVYARALSEAGEHERARPLLERLCKRGRASGDAAVNFPLVLLSWLEFDAGNWERAEELAREAYDIAVQTGREAAEPKGMFALAWIEAAQGKCDAARARAEEALVLTEGRGWNSGGPRGVLGFLDLSLENYEAAYEVLLPAIERYRSLGVPVINQMFDAVEALAGLGRVEDGRALLEHCKEAPLLMRVPVTAAPAARARGLLAAAEGDLVAAESTLTEAVEIGQGTGRVFDLGRSLLALGTVQRRGRKKQAARLTLERALQIFTGLGAAISAEHARRELARIGGRSTPRGELSETEAKIVDLVVLGRSNREVAQALHLSPKTIEWNLSKIYGRLGVHSRTELAAARRAPGLTE
jgi:DNA-binding CsgD family transcriptional regulator